MYSKYIIYSTWEKVRCTFFHYPAPPFFLYNNTITKYAQFFSVFKLKQLSSFWLNFNVYTHSELIPRPIVYQLLNSNFITSRPLTYAVTVLVIAMSFLRRSSDSPRRPGGQLAIDAVARSWSSVVPSKRCSSLVQLVVYQSRANCSCSCLLISSL